MAATRRAAPAAAAQPPLALPEVLVRVLGVVLVVAGLVALLAGGLGFTRRREVARVGPISASVKETERYPMARWIGGAMLIVGVGLLAAGGGRKRA